jgi:hypothetical protein
VVLDYFSLRLGFWDEGSFNLFSQQVAHVDLAQEGMLENFLTTLRA